MSYAILMVLLIYQAEKLPKNNLRVIISGLLFTPIIGAVVLVYYQRQMKLALKEA